MNVKRPFPFQLEASWNKILAAELEKPYMRDLLLFLESEYNQGLEIYPPKELIFNAFVKTPFDNVKVVIVGQDPYHGPGQAHGLCFSVPRGIPLPPSLKNIFKEISSDLGAPVQNNGCLESWAEQGVLLLNTTLSVRQNTPLSHHGKGWEKFTDAVIERLIEKNEPVIFVLWGKNAQEKCAALYNNPKASKHFVLTAAHPSPFSAYRGFLGCRHFSQVNEILKKLGKAPINWEIQDK